MPSWIDILVVHPEYEMEAYQQPSETRVNVAIAQCPAIIGPVQSNNIN